MKNSSRLLKIFCIFLIVVTAISSLCFSLIHEEDGALSPAHGYSVVIDPGHGGIDSGAIGVKTGNKESDLNLDLSFFLRDYCENGGISTLLTRETQDGLYGNLESGFKRRDMEARKNAILSYSPDMVISIHMNKFPSSARRGAQVYYQQGDTQSKKLADAIQLMLNTYINIPEQNRSFTSSEGDFYMCKIKKPAVIVECGFLSNVEDDLLLAQKSFRKKIAYTVYNGIVDYLMQSTLFIPYRDNV